MHRSHSLSWPGPDLSRMPPRWGHHWPVQGLKEQAPFEAKPAGAEWEGTRSRRCHTAQQAVTQSPLAPVPWLHPKARLDRWHVTMGTQPGLGAGQRCGPFPHQQNSGSEALGPGGMSPLLPHLRAPLSPPSTSPPEAQVWAVSSLHLCSHL